MNILRSILFTLPIIVSSGLCFGQNRYTSHEATLDPFSKEIRSKLGLEKLNQTTMAILDNMSQAQFSRLAVVAAKKGSVDILFDAVDSESPTKEFAIIGNEIMVKIGNIVNGEQYSKLDTAPSVSAYRFTDSNYRQTIVFQKPFISVGRRFSQPASLGTGFERVLELTVVGRYNLQTERGEAIVLIRQSDNPDVIEMPLQNFIEKIRSISSPRE